MCSISWGADEASWGAAAGERWSRRPRLATAAGMVVFAAAGDNDSSDGGPGRANVDLPASAPHVIGCGGNEKSHILVTRLSGTTTAQDHRRGYRGRLLDALSDAELVAEPARPTAPDAWSQTWRRTPIRTLATRSFSTAPQRWSAAPAPSPRSMPACSPHFGTKLGFVTPELYLNSACFTDITHGDNGAFRARTGVDPCTGLGSPIGEILEERIQPAAIHASKMRALLAENAQLRASVAQAQQRSCPGCQQAAAYGRPAALLVPRAAALSLLLLRAKRERRVVEVSL